MSDSEVDLKYITQKYRGPVIDVETYNGLVDKTFSNEFYL